jgi:hypothetical protein
MGDGFGGIGDIHRTGHTSNFHTILEEWSQIVKRRSSTIRTSSLPSTLNHGKTVFMPDVHVTTGASSGNSTPACPAMKMSGLSLRVSTCDLGSSRRVGNAEARGGLSGGVMTPFKYLLASMSLTPRGSRSMTMIKWEDRV